MALPQHDINLPEQCHSAFQWVRSEHIESLNIRVDQYQHSNTGASHYHINADNTENVFLVALRTIPTDSSGVAHILEHTALCGSEKYPVRDPFFMMIRRSLNTFMNAFTSSDWTAYPFASQNRKDFNNLLDVYLDAVFFSRLHELDFAQEGHRLEFSVPERHQSLALRLPARRTIPRSVRERFHGLLGAGPGLTGFGVAAVPLAVARYHLRIDPPGCRTCCRADSVQQVSKNTT